MKCQEVRWVGQQRQGGSSRDLAHPGNTDHLSHPWELLPWRPEEKGMAQLVGHWPLSFCQGP